MPKGSAIIRNTATQGDQRFKLEVLLENDKQTLINVADFIERNSESIRSKYLSWVYEIGAQPALDNSSVHSVLTEHTSINLWQMTLIAEKSLWKTPQILDALEIIAVQEILKENKAGSVFLDSDNPILAELVAPICVTLAIKFSSSSTKFKHPDVVTFRKRLLTVRGIIHILSYGILRFPYVILKNRMPFISNPDFLMVSYFDNYSITADGRSNRFISNYWSPIRDEMMRKQNSVVWIELSPNGSSVKSAIRESLDVNRINKLDPQNENHQLLNSFLTIKLLIQAFQIFLKLNRLPQTIDNAINLTSTNGIFLGPLFRDSWTSSIHGKEAIDNILWNLLFLKAISRVQGAGTCIYLQENQAWEVALIDSWRASTPNRIIGFPHSSIRYWDLRYFFDPKEFTNTRRPISFPDVCIANGTYAKNNLVLGGIPTNRLYEAEALRNLRLSPKKNIQSSKRRRFHVLIVGEYDAQLMPQLSDWVSKQKILSDDNCVITVKPHPNLQLKATDFLPLRVEITTRPLDSLFQEVDLVVTGPMSTAALDAVVSNVPLITVVDGNSLDLGPLRGHKRVSCTLESDLNFDQIEEALKLAENNDNTFYFTDTTLPRWKKLLWPRLHNE